MLGGQQTSLEIPVWAVPTPPHVTTWVYMALEGAKNLYSPLHSPSLAPSGEDSGVSSVVRADLSHWLVNQSLINIAKILASMGGM